MAKIQDLGLDVPFKEKMNGSDGILSQAWQNFFKSVFVYLAPMGVERSSQIDNNKTTATDLDGVQFDSKKIGYAEIEYLIHRLTVVDDEAGAGVEIVEPGKLVVSYNPVSKKWSLERILSKYGSTFEFKLLNNQSTPAALAGLKFNPRIGTGYFFDFAVHRITTGTGAITLIEQGSYSVISNPVTGTFDMSVTPGNWPTNSGVSLSISPTGQIQYTTSNIGGTEQVSKISITQRLMGNQSGVDFSITNGGQVQYKTTNITGVQKISKVTWRARTLAAKGYQAIPDFN